MPFTFRQYIRLIGVVCGVTLVTIGFLFLLAWAVAGLVVPELVLALGVFTAAMVWCFGVIVPFVFWTVPWVFDDQG